MGHVYRAVNTRVGRSVAVKVLRVEHAQNLPVVERFLREARAANLVRHPNVVDVLDVDVEAGGAPFIVQELLVGEDLAHLVERRGGKLPVQEVVDILGPVIDAVAEAHAQGVIHRDIKPENVFLAKIGRVLVPKLLDFGISKVSAPDLKATEAGVTMGTPAYMPPEQVQGARDADARSDVWALGVILFELIAGRLPFDARDAPAYFVAIATKDAPTLLDVRADVPAEVSRVVARCLRRRPDERYPSAAELARDLRHVVEGTELEPTGRLSIPPRVHTFIADLAIPAAPHAPTVMSEAACPGSPAPSDRVADREDLGQMHAAPQSRATAVHEARGSRLAVGASLPGVGLVPGVAPMAQKASHEAWGLGRKAGAGADVSLVIGAGVVGLVTVLGLGLLMQLAHRPEGWPVARFVLGSDRMLELSLHAFLALLVFVLGATFCWRGVRYWRGELEGGPPNAIINGIVAAVAFFCVIELVSAVF